MRLFCFPYAGGSAAAFTGWSKQLPSHVQLHPVALRKPWTRPVAVPHTVDELLDAVVPSILPLLDRPFAFFGHSMGTIVAYELARRLRGTGGPQPLRLYMSGRRAPHFADHDLLSPDASDVEFVDYLRMLGGTPAEVLADRQLMEFLLPQLRADFGVCRDYRWEPDRPLDCPITVLVGNDDEEARDDYVNGWQAHTTHPLEVARFPGGHFFLHSANEQLLSYLATSLRLS